MALAHPNHGLQPWLTLLRRSAAELKIGNWTIAELPVFKIEKIQALVHQAMGLLYAHNSLYLNGHGPNGTGLYRLHPQWGDQQSLWQLGRELSCGGGEELAPSGIPNIWR